MAPAFINWIFGQKGEFVKQLLYWKFYNEKVKYLPAHFQTCFDYLPNDNKSGTCLNNI